MKRHLGIAVVLLAVVIGVMLTPRLPQDPSYHDFADQRTIAGIPNALDVLSNVPFAFVGAWGLVVTFRRRTRFDHPWERWPYAALFTGSALTAIGSSYYHLAPDNARLVWDRLPMTIGFMGFLAATIAERFSVRAARVSFVPLLVFGAASVAYWHWTEQHGVGDLRPYVLVQFGSLLTIMLMLVLYPPRYSHTSLIFYGVAAYALAKVFELGDRQIFAMGHLVSGHALKHLSAAVGVAFLVAAVSRRHPERRG
jgi:hypothetical protein